MSSPSVAVSYIPDLVTGRGPRLPLSWVWGRAVGQSAWLCHLPIVGRRRSHPSNSSIPSFLVRRVLLRLSLRRLLLKQRSRLRHGKSSLIWCDVSCIHFAGHYQGKWFKDRKRSVAWIDARKNGIIAVSSVSVVPAHFGESFLTSIHAFLDLLRTVIGTRGKRSDYQQDKPPHFQSPKILPQVSAAYGGLSWTMIA